MGEIAETVLYCDCTFLEVQLAFPECVRALSFHRFLNPIVTSVRCVGVFHPSNSIHTIIK